MSNVEKNRALVAGSKNSKWAKALVGRLLTPVEMDEVAGGGANCDVPGRGTHNMSGQGTTFTQQGGGAYNQSGGIYNMNCFLVIE